MRSSVRPRCAALSKRESTSNRDPLSARKVDPLGPACGIRPGAVPEAPAFVDLAVMGEPAEECSRHFGVPEHAEPFTERPIGRYDD